MSMPIGVKLVVQRGFCVLNPQAGNHHPVNFSAGSEVKTVGSSGTSSICILPDGRLVPGIDVYFPNMSPHEFTIPLDVVKLVTE